MARRDKWHATRTNWAHEADNGVAMAPHLKQGAMSAPEVSAESVVLPAGGSQSTMGYLVDLALQPVWLYLHALLSWYALLYACWLAIIKRIIPLVFDPSTPPPDRLLRPNRGPAGSTVEAEKWLVDFSVRQLVQALRDRQITSTELVQMHIDQLQRVNGSINAAVNQRFQQALEQAKQADDRLQSHNPGDELPPLLGVPFSVKECLAFKGMPHTSGMLARTRNAPPQSFALSVSRAMEAGAIPLCFSNTAELCMWMETYNSVYGLTRNPYNLGRTPGGSSGGEASLVATACVPFGIGADVGGSIRLPASFCGVFGHKPTGGLVPVDGHHPISGGCARDMLTIGPIARHAEDLSILLRVLSQSSTSSASAMEQRFCLRSRRIPMSKVRVVVVDAPAYLLTRPVSAEVVEGVGRASRYLKSRGANVVYQQVPSSLSRGLGLWAGTMLLASSEAPSEGRSRQKSFAENMAEDSKLAHGTRASLAWALCCELLQWVRGRSSHTLPAIVLALLEQIPSSIPIGLLGGKAGILRHREEMEAELQKLLQPSHKEEASVLLCPTYPSVAQRHFEPYLTPIDFTHCAIWNALELPVTQVPLGLSKHGLPLGMQIVAQHGRDEWTLQVAEELERGGVAKWVPPPGFGLRGKSA